jgi:hypothetical protein
VFRNGREWSDFLKDPVQFLLKPDQNADFLEKWHSEFRSIFHASSPTGYFFAVEKEWVSKYVRKYIQHNERIS